MGSYVFTGGLCYWGLNNFTIHRVDGPSMRPTLNPEESKFRDWILVRQLSYPQQELIPLGNIICISTCKKVLLYGQEVLSNLHTIVTY